MVTVTPRDELKVKPLTKVERAWCESFDRLMEIMPKRLSILESASVVCVIDEKAGSGSALADGAASRDGVVLATIGAATCRIQSCSC